jgi:hypothetical protein
MEAKKEDGFDCIRSWDAGRVFSCPFVGEEEKCRDFHLKTTEEKSNA